MGNCKIVNCPTKSGERPMFKVPLDPVRRSEWRNQISKIQEFDEIPIAYPVCALHFAPDKLISNGKRVFLQRGTIPTYFPDANGTLVFYDPNIQSTDQMIEVKKEIKTEVNESWSEAWEWPIQTQSSNDLMSVDKHAFDPNIVKIENELHNVDKQSNSHSSSNSIHKSDATVTISSNEYQRLLHQEIQLIKYKELFQRKNAEIKRVRNKLYALEKQVEAMKPSKSKLNRKKS